MHQLIISSILLIPIFLWVFVIFYGQFFRRRTSRYPFDINNTHRIPGLRLLQQHNEAKVDLFGYLILLQYLIAVPFVTYVVDDYLDKPPTIWVYTLILPPALLYIFYKLCKAATNVANFRLGLEAEWFVAHQLGELSNQGYRAFHDVQADGFNIDHLVVGPNGVFAIETKGRRKPGSSQKAKPLEDKSHSAKINGNLIEFPHYQDKDTIPQALRQATWCSKWLSQAVGETINVKPVVALPGWYVEYSKNKSEAIVLSAKALPAQLPKLFNHPLNEQQINQVIYQVRQRIMRDSDEL